MNSTPEQPTAPAYALTFDVEYPDRPLNRLTSALRIFTVIPIAILLATLGTITASSSADYTGFAATGGILVLPPLLMIVFRQKYPRWWFDFNRELLRFSNRVYAYAALLNDKYPSTDEQQYVKLELEYPDAKEGLNRWLPLIKWLWRSRTTSCSSSSASARCSPSSRPGSRSCPPAATHAGCSTTWWQSCAGATA